MNLNCQRCGTSLRGTPSAPPGAAYCSLGCAALARIPVDADGNFPVNAPLLRLLAIAALYFNQLLFWSVSAFLLRQGKPVPAARLEVVAWICALGVWAGLLLARRAEGVAHRKDHALDLIAAALMLAVVATGTPAEARMPILAGVNATLLAWNFRHVFKSRKAAS